MLALLKNGDKQLLQFLKKNLKSCIMLFLLTAMMNQKMNWAIQLYQIKMFYRTAKLRRMIIFLSFRKRWKRHSSELSVVVLVKII
uniref:Eukaryotic translation initiation factor 2b, epsilon subunit, putative n=1 Tax=Arundo donax TaxID=35708 RepID=A0A0A9G9W0_ARUDO